MASVLGTALDVRSVIGRIKGWGHGSASQALGKSAVSSGPAIKTIIETEVIPRLMLAHSPPTSANYPQSCEISADEASDFALLAVSLEAQHLLDRVDVFVMRGTPVNTILLHLLAPSARRLGEFWEEDRCDFVEVTMGLWRLQEVARELSSRMPVEHGWGHDELSALFSPMPGEQHSFGTVMVEEFFRQDGWKTAMLFEPDTSQLVAAAAESHFDVIGLTVSCDGNIEQLPALIRALRSVSRNPEPCILTGGRSFHADPGLAARVGADGTAADAEDAVRLARHMIGASTRVVASAH